MPQVVGGAAAGGEWRGVAGKPKETEDGVREEDDGEQNINKRWSSQI